MRCAVIWVSSRCGKLTAKGSVDCQVSAVKKPVITCNSMHNRILVCPGYCCSRIIVMEEGPKADPFIHTSFAPGVSPPPPFPQIKKPLNFCQSRGFWSTRSRDRTGTASLPLVFETSASTNSAIRAYPFGMMQK